jgi:hypothetical protein
MPTRQSTRPRNGQRNPGEQTSRRPLNILRHLRHLRHGKQIPGEQTAHRLSRIVRDVRHCSGFDAGHRSRRARPKVRRRSPAPHDDFRSALEPRHVASFRVACHLEDSAVRGWFNRSGARVAHCAFVPTSTPTRSASEATGYSRSPSGQICSGCHSRSNRPTFRFQNSPENEPRSRFAFLPPMARLWRVAGVCQSHNHRSREMLQASPDQ